MHFQWVVIPTAAGKPKPVLHNEQAAEQPESAQISETKGSPSDCGAFEGAVEYGQLVVRPHPNLARRTRKWTQYVEDEVEPFLLGGGYAMSALAVVLFIVVSINYRQLEQGRFGAIGWFIFACIGAGIQQLWHYGKRTRAPAATSVVEDDPRSPVLFLRAFRDDLAPIKNAMPATSVFGLGQPWSRTFEEVLCGIFSVAGPIVGINRPGKKVPPLGASRFRVSDANWKFAIDELVAESQLIVIVIGSASGNIGLAWEIRRIFEINQQPKLVLVMPPAVEDDARMRWEAIRALCGNRLPEYRPGQLAASFLENGNCKIAIVPPDRYRPDRAADDSEYRSLILVECGAPGSAKRMIAGRRSIATDR